MTQNQKKERADGWGGLRRGAGRKPALTESDEIFLAYIATSYSHLLTAGTGKRHYKLRDEIISRTRLDFEEYGEGLKVSRNAVVKAWRKHKNHAVVKGTEKSAKRQLGMILKTFDLTTIPQE